MEMEVTLEEEDGSSFTMKIGSSDTVWEMKEKIEDHTDIPSNHQILSFQGAVLDDTRKVESYCITSTSAIRFQLAIVNPYHNQGGATRCPVQLFVKSTCSPSPSLQQADLRDSVLQFKRKLRRKLGISQKMLGVSLGPRHHQLQDAKRLYDYGLRDGSSIYIFTK